MHKSKSHKKMGALYSKEQTTFRVWAPNKKTMELLVFKEYNQVRRQSIPMTYVAEDCYEVTIKGDLNGVYYTYLIDGKYEVTDPYSVASSINSKKSCVIDLSMTHPDGWDTHRNPETSAKEAIIYEVHIKDFTSLESSKVLNRGKYIGFVETPLRADTEMTTGIEHLIELGVTHVHLLPVYDFITVNEEPDRFFDDDNYNWGYDPELYNVVEGSYSTDPYSPWTRIRELKTMIMELHNAGISVILDVVYNHTYKTLDSNFNMLAPNQYHRMWDEKSFSNGSGCGNEFATESPMGRHFLIESLCYWAREFRIDGFRFDLMALIDLDSMVIAREKLIEINPNMIIYGEPWMALSSTLAMEQQIRPGTQRGRGFALFNDIYRDSLKGDNDGYVKGYIQSDYRFKNAVETGIAGSIHYDTAHIGTSQEPSESINYFNSHDNLIIQDKMALLFGESKDIRRLTKLLYGILFTSQGIPLIHSGNEFLRSKKMVHNSYNAPLSVNGLDWTLKEINRDIFYYTRDLIALRKEYDVFCLKAEEVRNRLNFIKNLPDSMIGYTLSMLKNKVLLIIHNAKWENVTFDTTDVWEERGQKPIVAYQIFSSLGKTMKRVERILQLRKLSTSIYIYELEDYYESV